MDVASATVLELPAWERNYTGLSREIGKLISPDLVTRLAGINAANLCISTSKSDCLYAVTQIKRHYLEERVKALRY